MLSIQIENLLKEISPNHPSGEFDLAHDPDFLELEKEIQGTPEVGGEGGKVYQEAKDPDWSRCGEIALDLLERTHDLRVAVYLTYALLHTDGFKGLHDGLRLICGSLDLYWDTVYPQLDPDDEDPIERVNTLEMLTDWRMLIGPLMKIELCASRSMGKVNLRQYRIATGKASELSLTAEEVSSAPNLAAIEAIFADTSLEQLQFDFHDVSGSLAETRRMESLMNEKVGTENAPDLQKLIQVLGEINNLFKGQLSMRTSQNLKAKESPEEESALTKSRPSLYKQPTAPEESRSFDMVESREEVLELLDKICAYYEVFEPSSPVPFLLKRAMGLVTKNFMEILDDLVPDSLSQIEKICGTREEKEQ